MLGVKSANVDLIEISNNTLRAEILITLEDDTTAQITSELNI